ncbi:DDE_Tnp_1-associated family protein [Escherichia coli 2-222-05_S3_C2]|nr:DDE_Tnp_1-associated family protein [Escherichia coli 2-222-05_S3_C2]
MELKKLMEHISITPDYRQAWKVVHKLSDILLLTICAVISGAESWEDIEDFGETHLDFLSNMVILKMVFLFTIPLPELYPRERSRNATFLY